jgi:hypothetical protein
LRDESLLVLTGGAGDRSAEQILLGAQVLELADRRPPCPISVACSVDDFERRSAGCL